MRWRSRPRRDGEVHWPTTCETKGKQMSIGSDRRPWTHTPAALAVRQVLRRSGLGSRLAILHGGALVEEGWFRSFGEWRAIDRLRQPVPWYTYAFRHFLEPRLNESMRVFEYGTGLSTLWYAKRVAEVVAVEHDEEWAGRVRSEAPANCTVELASDDDDYVPSIESHGSFDIVVTDGLHRSRSAMASIPHLAPGGVLIWDNSDWPEFTECFPALQEQGFKQIGFKGMGPINRQAWETSILYRRDNCLNI